MKRLILIGLLFPILANAEVVLFTKNNAGGLIVLTDEMCNDNKNRLAYSTVDNADTVMGCWVNDKVAIHIRWYNGSLRSYGYENWEIVKKNDKQYY